MPIKEIKIQLSNLKPGMYVSRLDRPWLDAPYPLQGFYVESQQDIDQLLKYCKSVYVDVTLSKEENKNNSDKNSNHKTEVEIKESLINAKPKNYKITSSREDELKTANKGYETLYSTVGQVMDDLSHSKNLNFPALRKAVGPMIDSILRNPSAFAWLTRLKQSDSYTYNHSICTSVWAVAFGRQLGMPRKDLQSLALGALLFDIGKTKLPEKLINNPKHYNVYEFKLIKKHVDYSVELLKNTEGVNKDILDMAYTHHERYNGSGYPQGLKGDQISIFGKIAGIVDCYDAIITERIFASPISPHDAVKKLYDWRNVDFQAELVEQFIQVVGIYPVGTIIELSDGTVGVIVNQHQVWRLRPQIMLLLDSNKESLENFKTIDLFIKTEDEEGNPLDIVKCIEPGKYGIDPKEFYI